MKASYIKNTLMTTLSSMNSHVSSFVKNPGVDFTRNRKCPFQVLIRLILSMETSSLNREIRRFFQALSMPLPSKSAFVQQRKKLNESVFPSLFSALNDAFPFRKTFRGYHLLACDGSDVNIPPLKDDQETFVASNTAGVGFYQMHLNALYDILEERYAGILVQLRAQIDERQAFISLLNNHPVKGKCIYLADRGYFSFNVLAHLLRSGQFFVLRIISPDDRASFLKRFPLPDSEEFDTNISFDVVRSYKRCFTAYPDRFVCLKHGQTFDFIQKMIIPHNSTVLPGSLRSSLVMVRLNIC